MTASGGSIWWMFFGGEESDWDRGLHDWPRLVFIAVILSYVQQTNYQISQCLPQGQSSLFQPLLWYWSIWSERNKLISLCQCTWHTDGNIWTSGCHRMGNLVNFFPALNTFWWYFHGKAEQQWLRYKFSTMMRSGNHSSVAIQLGFLS